MVGEMKKWEDRKIGKKWKSGKIENILVYLICVWLGVEKLRDEKNKSLYKFIHKPLLKNDI